MYIEEIKRGLRGEIKKRENEQYCTCETNIRQMCKDVLAKIEEQESMLSEKDKEIARLDDLAHTHNIELLRKENLIAELEESHKKEVEQLLIEIAELKQKRDTAEKLLNKALYCVSNSKNHMMSLARKKNHADYKRCLAMARWCEVTALFYGNAIPKVLNKDITDHSRQKVFRRLRHYKKWHKRWLELAEKFKEAK